MFYLMLFLSFITLIFEGCGTSKADSSLQQENDTDLATEVAQNRIAFDECFTENPSPVKIDDLAKRYKDKCTLEELKGLNARFQCTKNACLQFFKPADQEVFKKFGPAIKACPSLEYIRRTCKE